MLIMRGQSDRLIINPNYEKVLMNMADEHCPFFRCTSGRWLYDEQTQLASRYVEFNVQA
jgi:hypothetical protein